MPGSALGLIVPVPGMQDCHPSAIIIDRPAKTIAARAARVAGIAIDAVGIGATTAAHAAKSLVGQERSVRSELREVERITRGQNPRFVQRGFGREQCEAVWQVRREFSYALRDTGLTKLNEDIVVPRSRLVELVNFAKSLEVETGIPIACFGHAGDGNIHTNLMVGDYADAAVRAVAHVALDRLFAWVLDHGGAITGEHGVGLAKKPWINAALGEVALDVHRSLKHALDPHNILNPGKFLDL